MAYSGPTHVIAYLSNDADFRTWVQAVEAKLLAGGWARIAQTGEIDPTTVNRPLANGLAGFRCYYLNDSYHGTLPIYMKVNYRVGSNQDRPRLALLFGTTLDGAGTIGGQKSSGTSTHDDVGNSGSKTSNADTLPMTAGGGEGYAWFISCDWANTASTSFLMAFCVERPRDILTGEIKASEGYLVQRVAGNGASGGAASHVADSGTPAGLISSPMFRPYAEAIGDYANEPEMAAVPAFAPFNGQLRIFPAWMVTPRPVTDGRSGGLHAGSVHSCVLWGTKTPYLHFGDGFGQGLIASGSHRVAARYEA